MKILAGDIGGTNTRLAVFATRGRVLEPLVAQIYSSRRHTSLQDILRLFLDTHKPDFQGAAFGIAGPVRDGVGRVTNLPWKIKRGQLAREIGIPQVWLLNDLEANAWGLNALDSRDLYTLNPGRKNARGNRSIISAGTGLGEAGLFWNGKQHQPFASEGGHSDFSPASEIEIALLQYLRQRYDHVSWELVVSGMGLINIHDFLCVYHREKIPRWLLEAMLGGDAAVAISRAAQEKKCPVCTEALALFVRLYGREAGNHALKIMATGGVYIGGGIAPKILEQLQDKTFLEAFFAKGSMEALMRDMPVTVVLNENTALYGSALYAEARMNQQ
ncbi:glucokinase [Thiolapillus sp.]